jgi:DNA-binding NarL/FixJ family response regulator
MLARGEPARALAIVDHLLASAPGQTPDTAPQPIPHVLLLRGEALLALGRVGEAIGALEDARRGAVERHALPLLWIVHRALGHGYRRQRRHEAARREYAAARALIAELAATLDDAPLGERFRRAALASLPPERPPRPSRQARQRYGGLTAREREVATLIARGATSRAIAQALVIGERTAETHVGHILAKLAFSSRAQIAAWAVEHGLTAP